MAQQLSPDMDRLITERELATRWGCTQRTLQRWRSAGSGPAFVRLVGSIRYRLADVRAFEDLRLDQGNGQ